MVAKVPKYDKSTLESLNKPEVVERARAEREAGAKIGSLSRSKAAIIDDLMKVKIPSAPAPAKEPPGAGAKDPRDVARERKDELTAELAALRIAHPEDRDRAPARGRVTEPVKLQAKPTFAEYKTWKRVIQEWMIGNAGETDACLCTYFLKAINDAQREVVFSVIPQGKLTCAAIIQVLDDEYVGDDICHGQDIHDAFRGCRRAGRALSEYVREWKQLRRKAMIAEVIVENRASDFQDLMRHAELTEAQSITTLAGLRAEQRMHVIHGGTPESFDKLESVFAMLKDIERAVHQTTTSSGGGRASRRAAPEPTALAAVEQRTTCTTCGKQHRGRCWSLGKGPGKGSDASGAKKSWKKNKKGGKGAQKGAKAGAKGAQGSMATEDWKCPCGFLVFGRSRALYCGRCGQKKAGANAAAVTDNA